MGVQRLYGTRQNFLDSLNIFFFGVLNSSGVGFSITPSAANLKTRYSDIYSISIRLLIMRSANIKTTKVTGGMTNAAKGSQGGGAQPRLVSLYYHLLASPFMII